MVFPLGYYAYIGSAMGKGSTSLKNRLKRHLKTSFENSQEHPHWHIDYLLSSSNVELVSIFILPNSVEKEECELSQIIKQYSDGHIPKFGSSDCSCESHLYFFAQNKKNFSHIFNSEELNLGN